MHKIQFVPECYAETELVKIVFEDFFRDYPENCYLNHASGIGFVSRILSKPDVERYLNIGFIDNDKKHVPHYFDPFVLLDQIASVIFKKHPDSNDYIVVVNPAIERFLLLQLAEISKTPSDYNLPDDFKAFKKTLKSVQIQYNEDYKRLISDLKVANTSGIQFISSKIAILRR